MNIRENIWGYIRKEIIMGINSDYSNNVIMKNSDYYGTVKVKKRNGAGTVDLKLLRDKPNLPIEGPAPDVPITHEPSDIGKILLGRLLKKDQSLKQLNKKVASNGMTYEIAQKVVDAIKKEFGDSCTRTVMDNTPTLLAVCRYREEFDPYKLPFFIKDIYFAALNAMMEIEENNPELVADAGITPTERPQRDVDLREKLYELPRAELPSSDDENRTKLLLCQSESI